MYLFNKPIVLGFIFFMIVLIIITYVLSRKVSIVIVLVLAGIIITLLLARRNHHPENEVERVQALGPDKNYDLTGRPRVVVSFSTIPSRIQYIPAVIRKLQKQSFQPDMIYVNVPYHSKRLNRDYILPEDLDLGPKVQIIRCEDYGPATKLLGSISKEKDPNTAMITIDDDQDYDPDTLKTLVAYSIKYPNNVIAFRTLDSDLERTPCPTNKNIKTPEAFYAEGFAGVLYKRSFISNEMLEYFQNISPDCFVSDDLVLSTWMDIQGYDRIKICEFQNTSTDVVIDANDALHRDKRKKVYDNCSKEMDRLRSLNLLKHVTQILDENNIPYWLDYGTLLGAIRDNDLIDGDNDIDIGTFKKDHPRIQTLLEKALPRNKIQPNGAYNEHINVSNHGSRYTHLDIYGYTQKDGFIQIEHYSKPRLNEWMFPLQEVKVKGISFRVPNMPELILEAEYGDISKHAKYNHETHLYDKEGKQPVNTGEKEMDKYEGHGLTPSLVSLYRDMFPEWWKRCVNKVNGHYFWGKTLKTPTC